MQNPRRRINSTEHHLWLLNEKLPIQERMPLLRRIGQEPIGREDVFRIESRI
jgi:hypothetical protein